MVIVVMGVSGAGKTAVGVLLAARLGWPFYDADDFHPESNIEKMSHGIALTDEDRRPWLESLGGLIRSVLDDGSNAVLACSALKSEYRDYLMIDPKVRLVYLRGTFALIQERLDHRHGHFMPPDLLKSQFEALEEPSNAIVVDISRTPAEIAEQIVEELKL